MSDAYPLIPLLIGALLCPLAGRAGRNVLTVIAPAVAAGFVLGVPDGAGMDVYIAGLTVELWRMDALSRAFALAFTLYGVVAALFAWSEQGAGKKIAGLTQVIGGTGIVLAGDLWSLLLFWEMLTVSSLFLIWFGGHPRSFAAGFRYLFIHMAGGLCLLAGAIMVGGDMAAMTLDATASWLILIGLITNAAVPPLHAWLPDAYPRASVYGTVYLAAFTTKAAVYVLARMYPDTSVLIWLGTIMALYGVCFAVLENNIRRLLGYHIVSQVGYMVAGVGMAVVGTKAGDMALNGATAHAFAHIFYKGLLMMSAGAVIYATGCGKLTELGGLSRSMKLTFVFFTVGAFSISGMPLFNGYVSKSMVVSAAKYQGLVDIYLLLVIASMGTFLSIALKLLFFTFLHEPKAASVQRRPPLSMHLAMGLTAAFCLVTGLPAKLGPIDNPLSYKLLYQFMPMQDYQPVYKPHTWSHFIGTMELLIATTLAFWIVRTKLLPKPKVTLDIDRLYRRPTAVLVDAAGTAAQGLGRRVERLTDRAIHRVWTGILNYRDLRSRVALAHQLAVIVFALVVVGYLAMYLLR